jgi:hypothetical protein
MAKQYITSGKPRAYRHASYETTSIVVPPSEYRATDAFRKDAAPTETRGKKLTKLSKRKGLTTVATPVVVTLPF